MTPPPRPSRINNPPAVVNEDRPVRSTTITIRWDTVLTAGAAFVLGIAVAVAVALPVVSSLGAVNEDVPYCTDPIADAGGVCHGEPLAACATEDSANCYWDATRGNGLGRSFVDVDGTVHYQDVTP